MRRPSIRGEVDHEWAVRARIGVVSVAPERVDSVFDEIERWAPRMDFADACAVVLVRSSELAFVLTTDFRGFSTYRVPFALPKARSTLGYQILWAIEPNTFYLGIGLVERKRSAGRSRLYSTSIASP